MSDILIIEPADTQQLADTVRTAATDGVKLAVSGGCSKDAIGRPQANCTRLSMRNFAGVIDYDPPELVLTAGAATPLAEIEQLLAQNNQMLAFEPFDPAPMLGGEPGRATIGGTIAAGMAGSQRLTQGSVRDHLLGFTAVSGRGDVFVAGGKVVKNVTGYDLSKLMCGSWGRLAAMTEVTLKVLPRPATSATLIAAGLTAHEAWHRFATILGSRAEIVSAAHLPAGLLGGESLSAVRVQGFAPSVEARSAIVAGQFSDRGFAQASIDTGKAIWDALRDFAPLPAEKPLWRIMLPARQAPAFVDNFDAAQEPWMMDWAGGLVWLSSDRPPSALRDLVQVSGGHAMLIRAESELRTATPPLHPLQPAIAQLEERVFNAFDPQGVFATGRF